MSIPLSSSPEIGLGYYNHNLEQVMEFGSSSPDYAAVCVFTGAAFGFGWEEQLIQLKSNQFIYQSANDGGNLSAPKTVHLDIDFVDELNALKIDNVKFRSSLNKNPDLKTSKEYARIGTVYLSVGNEAEWLSFPRQLNGGFYENNAINRICAAFNIATSETGTCSFTLVEKEEAKPILESIDDWPMYLRRHSIELQKLLFTNRQPIRAYATKQLVKDAREEGFKLQNNQSVEIIIATYRTGGTGLIEFAIDWSQTNQPIRVSPNYLRLDKNEPFYAEIKAYQDSLKDLLQDLKWISKY